MKTGFLWAGLVLILAGLACNLPFGIGAEEAAAFPDLDSESFSAGQADQTLLEPVELSGAQRQILVADGRPDRFLLQFSEAMRQETWYYDKIGYTVTFRNGDIYTENSTPPNTIDPIVSSAYQPWQFNRRMGLSELLAVSQSASFALESLDEVFEDDLSIVYLDGLDVGFNGSRVLYIRTIPLENTIDTVQLEERSATTDEIMLSEFEAAVQGTHTYQVACNYSDGTVEDYVGPLTLTFTLEGLFIDGDGAYQKVAENNYQYEDGDTFFSFEMVENGVYSLFGLPQEVEGEVVVTTGTCVFQLSD